MRVSKVKIDEVVCGLLKDHEMKKMLNEIFIRFFGEAL